MANCCSSIAQILAMPPAQPGSTPRPRAILRPVPFTRPTAPVHAASPASPLTSPSPIHRDISRSPRITIHKHTITNVERQCRARLARVGFIGLGSQGHTIVLDTSPILASMTDLALPFNVGGVVCGVHHRSSGSVRRSSHRPEVIRGSTSSSVTPSWPTSLGSRWRRARPMTTAPP